MTVLFLGTIVALFVGILASDRIVQGEQSLVSQFGLALGIGARRLWIFVMRGILIALGIGALFLVLRFIF
jgi:hypothetical protein